MTQEFLTGNEQDEVTILDRLKGLGLDRVRAPEYVQKTTSVSRSVEGRIRNQLWWQKNGLLLVILFPVTVVGGLIALFFWLCWRVSRCAIDGCIPVPEALGLFAYIAVALVIFWPWFINL